MLCHTAEQVWLSCWFHRCSWKSSSMSVEMSWNLLLCHRRCHENEIDNLFHIYNICNYMRPPSVLGFSFSDVFLNLRNSLCIHISLLCFKLPATDGWIWRYGKWIRLNVVAKRVRLFVVWKIMRVQAHCLSCDLPAFLLLEIFLSYDSSTSALYSSLGWEMQLISKRYEFFKGVTEA